MGKLLEIIKDAYKRLGEEDVPDENKNEYTAYLNNTPELANAVKAVEEMEKNIQIINQKHNRGKGTKTSKEDSTNMGAKTYSNRQPSLNNRQHASNKSIDNERE